MAKKLQADTIDFIVSMNAKGVGSELYKLSNSTKDLNKETESLTNLLKESEERYNGAVEKIKAYTKAEMLGTKAHQRALDIIAKSQSEIDKYSKKIEENTNLITQNKTKTDLLIQSIKLEDMTMAQLKKRASELSRQLSLTSKSLDTEAWDELDKKLKEVNGRMAELKTGAQSTMSVMKGGLMVATGNLLTKGAEKVKELVSEAKEWVQEGINMAKGAISIEDAFKGLSNSARIMKEMKSATSDTINELDLMKKAIKANELGIPIENMGKLLDYARRQAAKLGTDVDYMATSIVDGIGRKSTLILDNLGISATRVQSEVKKTGDFTQAVMKIVNDELQKQGSYAETAADQAAQASAKWENAQLSVGKKFMWLGELWDTISGGIADQIISLAGDTRTLNEQFDDQLNKVADMEVNIIPLAQRYDELKSKVTLNAEEQSELNKIMNTISGTIPGVITEFDKYGNILSINTSKVYDYIESEKARLQFVNKDLIANYKKQREELQKEYDIQESISKYGKTGYISGGSFGGSTTYTDNSPETIKKAEDKVKEIGKELEGLDGELARLSGSTMDKLLNTQKEMVTNRQKFTSMNKKELDQWIKDEKNANSEYLSLAEQTYKQRFGDNGDITPKGSKSDPELQRQKKLLAKLNEDLEIAHKEKLTKINKDYLSGEIKTEADYNRKIYAQEQAYYLLREQSLKDFIDKSTKEEVKLDASGQLATVQEKMLSQQIKYQKEIEKILLDANPVEKEKRAYQERLDAVGLFGIQQESMTADQLAALEILEKQHQDNLDKIRKAGKAKAKADAETAFLDGDGTEDNPGFKKRKEEMQTELNELMATAAANPKSFDAEMAVHVKRLEMINEEIEARNKAGLETTKQIEQQGKIEANMTASVSKELQKRAAQFQQYGNTVGQALGNVMTGQENALKAFGDASVDIVFDILSKIIEAELIKVMASSTSAIMRATAEAMATPQSALSFGAAGFATAAILTGAITAATVAAKSALKGMLGKKKGSSASSSGSDSGKSSGNITVKQRAEGKYDVMGADDGRMYRNVPYSGDAKTGIVSRPTLMGERGSELVVSHPDFMALQKHINYPVIMQAIQDARFGRVPQRAEGKYDGLTDPINIPSGFDPVLLERFIEVMDRLDKKEFKTYLGMTDYQAKLEEMNKEDNRFTKK